MKKIFSLLLAILLLSNLVFAASADAYIPPEESYEGFDMESAYAVNGTCKALNTFLSNFAEMGLAEYSSESTDEQLIPAVLKHMELNARYYPNYVKKLTKDGNPYMQINGNHFEERAEHLFGRTIPASECPGYEGGKIVVSADHYDGPIQVFASVYDCMSLGDELYRVSFDVLRVDTDFSGWYTTAYPNLPWGKLSTLGSGSALVVYGGGKTDKTISTSDFMLIEFSMDAQDIPCMGENLPYGYVEPTEPPTEAPISPEAGILDEGFDIAVDTVTEPAVAPAADASTEPATEDSVEKPSAHKEKEEFPAESEEDEEKDLLESEPIDITMVLIIILVAAVVLLALLLIVIFFIKKKQSR